ncbi:hypothetical protein [Nocardioides sp.]|uniref:hypothetical protein n=1 Tax=Nocardioides sp. TaxID=35761 RepID=UPI003516E5DB
MSAMLSDEAPGGGRRRRDVPTDSPPVTAGDPLVDPLVDEALAVGAQAQAEARARLIEEERRLMALEAELRRAAEERETAEGRLRRARADADRLAREAERALAEGIAAAERVAAVQRLGETTPEHASTAPAVEAHPLPPDPVMMYAAQALTAQAAEAAEAARASRESGIAPDGRHRSSPVSHRAPRGRDAVARAAAPTPPSTRGPSRLGGAFRTAGVVVCVGVAALAGSAYLDSQKALATSELCLSAGPIDRAQVRGVMSDLGRGRISADNAGAARLRGMVTTGLSAVNVPADLSGEVPAAARALQSAERRMAAMINAAAATAAAGKDWKATPSPQELVALRNRLFGAEDAFRAACSDLAS